MIYAAIITDENQSLNEITVQENTYCQKVIQKGRGWMMEQQMILNMQGITKVFPGVRALDHVTLNVHQGSIHAICGENGAGKSTLMKLLSGVYPHGTYEGHMIYMGKEVTFRTIKESEAAGIVIIHQELTMIPELSITENIFMGNEILQHGLIDWEEEKRRTSDILRQVGLQIDPGTLIKHLGVGQQQMVEIAKAISFNSKILVLDEPTATLTEREIDQLFEIIRRLKEKGVGMVYISHRMAELNRICERVTVIRDGQYIGTRNLDEITMDELVNMIVGRSLEDKYPKHVRTIKDVVFEAKNVRRGTKVNADYLYVRKGEILGISGLVGAGRTELMRCIFGADRPDSMELWMDGKPIKIRSVIQAIKNGIGYATEKHIILVFLLYW